MSNEQETKSQSALDNCTAIVVDVAGTTTSIKFVEDTLFPFVNEHVAEFLKANWDENHVKDAVKLLKKSDDDKTETPTLDEAVELIKTLTEKQDTNSGLKTIQGLIYKNGYENGKLKGHVFDDVPGSFEAWAKLGKKIAIYSTGSVESQTLLFSHTANGDLTKFLTKYYDQSVIGIKTDSESYQKIASDLDMKTNQIVFISDNLLEIKAAKSAGFNVLLIHRDGNEKLPETANEFTTIASFKDVSFETTTKRKSDDKETTVEEEPPSKIPKTDTIEKSENTTADKDKDELKEDKVEKMVEDEIVKDDKQTDENIETDSDKTVVDKKQCDNKETGAENSEKSDESTKTVDDKKDEKSATIEEEKTSETAVAEENKDKTTTEDKENGETTTTTTTTVEENAKNEATEEKENKNVLANGVENKDDNNMEVVDEQPPVVEISKDKDETKTNDDNETTTTTSTTTTATKTDEENTETTPVKKLDETTKSPAAVSVEV